MIVLMNKPPSSFSPLLLLLSFQSHQHSITNALDPECSFSESQDFACPTPYKCRVGRKNFDGLLPTTVTDDGPTPPPPFTCDLSMDKYCDCDESDVANGGYGATGCRCGSAFRVCDDGLVCLHGAPCVSVGRKGEDGDGEEQFMCGCAYAVEGGGDVTWVGDHCEYGVTGENLCGDSGYDNGHKGEWFCTDNGTCRVDEADPLKKCDCDEGYFGLHCELRERHACDTTCLNDGVCTRGVKKVDHAHGSDDRHGGGPSEKDTIGADTKSHCVCPYPYAGETCADVEEDDRCGCENGASCRLNVNTGRYYCDCGTADVEDEEGNVVSYAGKKCESSYSTMCPVPNGYDAKEYFCTNGGGCPDDFHEPCKCTSLYSGPRCEFTSTTTAIRTPCNLPCENDGTCFFGSSPDTAYDDLDLTPPASSEMHCKCPVGYAGFLCETRSERCADGMTVCANGGVCVEKEGGDGYGCDCGEAIDDDGTPYAGKRCENPATSVCTDGGRWFCTNGGVCGDDEECLCEPGYGGDRCELAVDVECPGGTHSCASGEVCVVDGEDWVCDCSNVLSSGKGTSAARGETCENPATSVCVGPNSNVDGFCANGGVCKDDLMGDGKSHPGCLCKSGYGGDYCEILLQICPHGKHSCKNGGVCVKDDASEDWMCDCTKAVSDGKPYAGEKCENPATSVCVGPGAELDGFCTNGGVCKDDPMGDGEGHPGCVCRHGYTGNYCEFSGHTRHATAGVARRVFVGFGVSVVVLVAAFFLVRYRLDGNGYSPSTSVENHRTHGGTIGVPPDYDPSYDFEIEHDNTLEMVVADEDVDGLRVYGMDN